MYQDSIYFPKWMDGRNNIYKYQLPPWLVPIGIGALGGLLSGGDDVTQTTQMIPPPRTTQEQILINQMANWLYQAAPQYQGYINQTLQSIYGGAPGTPTVGEGYMGEKVPGQLTGELGEEYQTAVQLEADYQRQFEDWKAVKSRLNAFEAYNKLINSPEAMEQAKTGKGRAHPLITEFVNTVEEGWRQTSRDTYESMEDRIKAALNAEMKITHGLSDIETQQQYKMWQKNPETFEADYLGPEPSPPPQIHGGVDERYDVTATTAEPAWSPFEEIMSWTPERIAEYYGIERTKQQREIEDWYGQAQREASQRGISQYGGYQGSGTARDVALLAAEKARMQTGLSESMRQLELSHLERKPYEMLSAAQGLLGTIGNLQQPWLQVGQYLGTPYGPSTQISTQPGASAAQGALAGAMTGAGLYGMGQGLGWWGTSQPATPYGAGLTGPSIWQQGYGQSGMSSWGYGPYNGYWYKPPGQ